MFATLHILSESVQKVVNYTYKNYRSSYKCGNTFQVEGMQFKLINVLSTLQKMNGAVLTK